MNNTPYSNATQDESAVQGDMVNTEVGTSIENHTTSERLQNLRARQWQNSKSSSELVIKHRPLFGGAALRTLSFVHLSTCSKSAFGRDDGVVLTSGAESKSPPSSSELSESSLTVGGMVVLRCKNVSIFSISLGSSFPHITFIDITGWSHWSNHI